MAINYSGLTMVYGVPNELQHHGILGQKWGVQNGPPYPLSSSQKSSSEKRKNKRSTPKTKEEILKSGTVKEIIEIRDELTEQEIRNAINRISIDQQLDRLRQNEINAGFDKINRTMSKIEKVNTWVKTGTTSYRYTKMFLDALEKAVKKNKKKEED